ncbi:glucokinase [Propylenella binzhouense]|uniref:glucokinase n=1 Tax=Propylenella binzhouense TaxID=2555902 RepID=UPI003CCCE016
MLQAAIEPLAFPVLIGDIGGTNVRFALLSDANAEPRSFPPVETRSYPDIETAIEENVLAHTSVMPRSAVIAVAGPVSGNEVDLTNADWIVRPHDIVERIGVADVILLNDFEALALALPELKDNDLHRIGGGAIETFCTKVVVGPGTGLGVGGLAHAARIWVPLPGEGGHVSFGPVEPDEFPVWRAIEPEHGRISAESLLAGRGIVRLYRAVATVEGSMPQLHSPAMITDAALSGTDPCAERTIELYARLLGRLAGDLALVLMARGGVYVGGGIAPRLIPFLERGEFRRAFEAKAPHDELMRGMSTVVITRESPALLGLAAFARTPNRFGVSLTGRRWKKAAVAAH